MKKMRGTLTVIFLLLPAVVFAAEPAHGDTGITAWMLTSTALVLFMVPGLALFYGGLVRAKNVLGTMMHSFVAMAVIGVLWAAVGYSMAFGHNVLGGWFGWNPDYVFFSGIDTKIINNKIPEYVFAMFQGKFAIITPALIAGAFAERIKFRGYIVFIILWSLLVYNPLAHLLWADGGFLTGKAIDFAGGTVIHISAGIAALVTALYLGARRGYPKTAMRPNNLTMTLLGAGILWVGWFGFNAGSSIGSGLKTAQALTVTQLAAGSGGLMWMAIEAIKYKKATSLGFVSGVLSGLVAITPAAGDVLPYGAILLGMLAATVSFFTVSLKEKLGYDDTLDVFGIHGISGIVGALALVLFLRPGAGTGSILSQLSYQSAGVGISIVYSAVMTILIVVLVEKIVGFRLTEEEEKAGIDFSQHGEKGYGLNNIN